MIFACSFKPHTLFSQLLRLESPSEKKTSHQHKDTVNAVSTKVAGSSLNSRIEIKVPCLSDQRFRFSNSSNLSKENLKVSKYSDISNLSRLEATSRSKSTIPSHVSTHQTADTPPGSTRNIPPRKHLIQASTSELLDCLGQFVCQRCHHVKDIEPADIPTWFRGIDQVLFKLGWHEISFIMPSSVVFVYLLCREVLVDTVTTVHEVQCIVLTCLYMSYSYMGNEISYPLRPFLIDQERSAFWGRCCAIANRLSWAMLRINCNSHYFTTIFRELITFAPRPLKSHTESTAFQNRIVVNGERKR